MRSKNNMQFNKNKPSEKFKSVDHKLNFSIEQHLPDLNKRNACEI